MIEELLIDLAALVLVAAGVWLLFPPAGLIVGGLGLAWLSIGIKYRRGHLKRRRQDDERSYRAVEVEDV